MYKRWWHFWIAWKYPQIRLDNKVLVTWGVGIGGFQISYHRKVDILESKIDVSHTLDIAAEWK